MTRALQAATLVALVCGALSTFNFVSIGDWGCVPIGGYHEQDELIVARTFQQAATELDARFVLNTGDNFYYCGVHNKTDAMWDSTFENVFTAESMMVPWYGCLGNHDYGYPGSATAQLEYVSPKNNRWVMPDRYYYKRLSFPGEVNISLVVMDASPCQSDYVNDNPKYWDPCGSVIPGCPGCTFHANIIKQQCSTQLTWLNQLLPTIPADDWKIVMIHAPAGDIDVSDLITPLQHANFDMYINGHVHLLTHYTMDNAGTYITTGAACMVRVPSAAAEKKVEMPEVRLRTSSCPYSSNNGHSCQVVWEQVIAGYTTHTFSSDFSSLSTMFYDYDGNLLHTAVTQKGGSSGSGSGVTPATPSPADSSSSNGESSSSSGSCCYYKSTSCSKGQTCCDAEGKSYGEYYCKENGAAHHCKWEDSKCIVE